MQRIRLLVLATMAAVLAIACSDQGMTGPAVDPGDAVFHHTGEHTAKDQCKNGGYRNFTRQDDTGFANQGECIEYVEAGHTLKPIVGPPPPTKESCKNGGYLNFTRTDGSPFKNQGQCISYVEGGGTLVPVTTTT